MDCIEKLLERNCLNCMRNYMRETVWYHPIELQSSTKEHFSRGEQNLVMVGFSNFEKSVNKRA